MKIFEQLSDFWFQHLPILPEDYRRGMEWNLFPRWSTEHYFMSLLAAFLSGSGLLISQTKGFFDVLIISAFVACILDFLILSRISSKNKKFLQDNPEKSAKNPHFIIFFIFWRILLPDIFIVSSLSARYFRMNLNKKQIFLISLCAQSVRILILAIIYFGISINF
ncbi:MAG: hypothetical protein Q4A35_01780 [Candidatus Gracilibacteria bacterium]|nr:hypothetical protein [Candidatus Gracilibacteria bacterium]